MLNYLAVRQNMSYSKLEKTIIDIGEEYHEMIINSKSEEEINKLEEDKDLDIIAVRQLWNESPLLTNLEHSNRKLRNLYLIRWL